MGLVIHATWLLVVLAVLATARLTVLVNDDLIAQPLRTWVTKNGARPTATYFVQCPWCVSMWIGFAAGGVVYAWHDTWPVQVGLLALAASYVTGTLAERRPE